MTGTARAVLEESFLAAMNANQNVENTQEFDTSSFLVDWAYNQAIDLRVGDEPDALAEVFWRPWVGCLDLMEGVESCLGRLVSRGCIIGLVSNVAAAPAACEAELARQGLHSLFHFVYFSSSYGIRKPSPRVYESAAAMAKSAWSGSGRGLVESEMLFVGDTPVADIDGPAKMGMRTALVRGGNWSGDLEELRTKPDLVLDSVNDLPVLLE